MSLFSSRRSASRSWSLAMLALPSPTTEACRATYHAPPSAWRSSTDVRRWISTSVAVPGSA
eukprot:2234554-Pyramimonas_sp.AAC.1